MNCQVMVFYKTQEEFLRSCAFKKEQSDNGNSFIVRQRKRQFAQHTKHSEFNNNTSQVSQTTPSKVCLRNVIPRAPTISKSSLKRYVHRPMITTGMLQLSNYLHLQKTARHENILCEVSKTSSHFNITAE